MNKKKIIKMLSFVISFIVLFFIGIGSTFAYKLPEYIVSETTSILDDMNYLGITNKAYCDGSTLNNSNDKWEILAIEENYTDREGYITQYVFLHNNNPFYTNWRFYINMTINDNSYNLGFGDNDKPGYEMELVDSTLSDIQKYYVLKFKVDMDFINKDESRTYSVSNINSNTCTYGQFDGASHGSMDSSSNYSKTFTSVIEKNENGDNTDVVISDCPEYMYCHNSYDEIYFAFGNCNANTSQIISIVLNDEVVPLIKDVYWQTENIQFYCTSGFGLNARGSKTYKINKYNLASGVSYDISDTNTTFRYESTLTSVWVKANVEIVNDWVPFGGNFTYVSFNLVEKDTNREIFNALKVQAKYSYKGQKYSPVLDVAKASITNAVSTAWKQMWNSLPFEGVLFKAKTDYGFDGYNYRWGFDYKITNFDVLYVNYQVQNEIITGSCYEDGLHVVTDEGGNKVVYDTNGVLRSDVYADDNDVLYKVDSEGNKVDLDTTNPPSIIIDNSDTWFEKIVKQMDEVFKPLKFIMLGIGVILGISLLKLIFKPVELLIALIRGKK